ncbi:MAG: heavy metal-binding domain-containing protein [Pseudomonadota bacterium]
MTTETATALPISDRIEIITAECVLGMNIFNDFGSAIRDVIGCRNETYQAKLREARKTVLDDLRREAHAIGADAVVAIDLDYSEISGGGKSMLFLVASGTAVRLATTAAPAS